ncbi:hypothetical protein WCE02_05015 [Pseudomonas juntendi]|uniref:hypothetical protein n=1 Tax=Pseudomonas TaxID=286 RepID=UPI0034D72E5B
MTTCLFDCAVNHLVNVWGVPVFLADRLVHQAMTERMPKGSRWIGIDLASGPDTCILRDHRVGKSGWCRCAICRTTSKRNSWAGSVRN